MASPLIVNDPLGDHSVILKGHSNSVYSVAFSPTDQLLASGSFDNTIQLWNTESPGTRITTLGVQSDAISSVAFSPDGAMLASGSWNGTIKLWDVGFRSEIATLEGDSSSVWSVAFSPDGASLVSGSKENTVRLWDVKSRTSISTLEGHSGWVRSVEFSPDGKRIASGSDDHTIRLWDMASRTTIEELKGHTDPVRAIAFSPTGEYLASGSWDKTIRLWSAARGNHIGTLEGHGDVVRSVAFSPNGKHLASGSFDYTTRIWDVASKAHISTLQGHSGTVYSVAFSPDGTGLASGSDDTTIRIWSSPPGGAREPRDIMFTSDLTGLSQNSMYSQEDELILTSASVLLSNDITGTVSLEDGIPIGYGGFGDLFLGVHSSHGKVALKKPRKLLDEALIRRFLREVDLWCSVTHPNVLACLGMCKIGLDVYVVSPFIKNGDLLSCMAKGMDLNRSKLLFEVAEALTHLHHRGIVHGDVKAQNVLLGDDGSALLCDFGLAKAFDTMATSTESKGAGSVRWMAPELFQDESRSMASDVYSLGITIAEVVSGHAPYLHISSNLAVMRYVADHGGRPPKEPLVSPEGRSYVTLWETAEKCWVHDAKARPHMAQVLGMLFPLTRERA